MTFHQKIILTSLVVLISACHAFSQEKFNAFGNMKLEKGRLDGKMEIIKNDGIVGIAFFYIAYSTWKGKMLYLDDLVITESWRRKGIGGLLLDKLLKYGHEKNVNQIRWHVLDWNEPAINMYRKIGVELDSEWIWCKMSRSQIEAWVR